jgi:hypothetical protein
MENLQFLPLSFFIKKTVNRWHILPKTSYLLYGILNEYQTGSPREPVTDQPGVIDNAGLVMQH